MDKYITIKHRGREGTVRVTYMHGSASFYVHTNVLAAPLSPRWVQHSEVNPGEPLMEAVEKAALRCVADLGNFADFEELTKEIDTDAVQQEPEGVQQVADTADLLAQMIGTALGSRLVNSDE